MNLAPIILFVYNRPEHTRQTLEALMANDLADQSEIYVYADGAKEGVDEEGLLKIKEVRRVIREKKWCKEVHVIESEKNNGLANSIIKGVTEIVDKYGKVIILEDDIVPTKGFLKYMNEALYLYEDEDKVMSISAYMYPIKKKFDQPGFLKFESSWGWATWKKAWQNFNPDASFLVSKIKEENKIKEFNFGNSYNFFEMLEYQEKGKIDSWAIRWYASIFLKGGLSLFPNKSFVKNIGHDDSGVHSYTTNVFDSETTEQVSLENIIIQEDKKLRKSLIKYFIPVYYGSRKARLLFYLKNFTI